jgi:hypothetical protein
MSDMKTNINVMHEYAGLATIKPGIIRLPVEETGIEWNVETKESNFA